MIPRFYKFSMLFHQTSFVVMIAAMIINGALNAGYKRETQNMLANEYMQLSLEQLTELRVV